MSNRNFLVLAGIGLIIGLFAVVIFLIRANTLEDNIDTTPTPTTTGQMTPSPDTSPTLSPSPTDEVFEQLSVEIFLVALANETNGQTTGETFGCGDTLVGVEREIEARSEEDALRTAIEELLEIEDQNVTVNNMEVYNSLANSNLMVDNVEIVDGTAEIELSGQLQLGGVCDNPRVEEQFRATALQFNSVQQVEIMLNEETLDEALSGQD